jgi:predicted O-linked N-acetylglucosamine transferase (SPINDLY family)
MTVSDPNDALVAADRAMKAGDWPKAAEILTDMAASGGGSAVVQNALGICHGRQGQHVAAMRAFAVAHRLDAGNPDFLFNLATAQKAAGEIAGAIAAYRRLLDAVPGHAQGWFNLGNALMQAGETEAAIDAYERAVAIRRDWPDALRNRAVALVEAGRHADALPALEEALSAVPGDPALRRLKARALSHGGQTKSGITLLNASSDPADLELVAELSTAAGDMDAAYDALDRGGRVTGDPVWRVRRMLAHPPVLASAAQAEALRHEFEAGLDDLRGTGPCIDDPLGAGLAPAFYQGYHGEDECRRQVAWSSLCRELAPSLNATAAHVSRRKRAGERLRIAFVSRHLVSHTVGQLVRGFIAGLDRLRFEVHVVGFAPPADPVAHEIAASADAFHVVPRDVPGAQRALAAIEADILFYPDLGMEPLTWLLAHARLARLQCAYLGHPVTTGIDTMDAFISGVHFEPEGAEDHYSERLYRLPGPATFYFRPEILNRQAASGTVLSPGRHSYFCGQSLFKMHPDFDGLLAAILRGDPAGEVLLVEGGDPAWSRQLRKRFDGAHPDVSDRLRFLPRMGYDSFLALTRDADVLLDTTHWSGGNTALEAISLGRPMVMLPGRFMRGRVSAGMYEICGAGETICGDGEAYVRSALSLGLDPNARQRAREAVAEGAHRLFETAECLRELERILTEAYLGAS